MPFVFVYLSQGRFDLVMYRRIRINRARRREVSFRKLLYLKKESSTIKPQAKIWSLTSLVSI
jgi:hypothetical protein